MRSEQNNNQKYAGGYIQPQNMTLKELYDKLHSVDKEILNLGWKLESAKAAMMRVNPTSDEFISSAEIADSAHDKLFELRYKIRPSIMNCIQREEAKQEHLICKQIENETRMARCKDEYRVSLKELISMSDNVESMNIDNKYRISSDEIKTIRDNFIGFEEHIEKAFNIGFFKGMDYMSERIDLHDKEGNL